ncbi:hypothetical protein PQR66_11945 [Paraburkholderia agricolaris]|uniref:Uncharacterized protein n=1 Tax=Paraburkholderia agricolaris TaxID=2152888 RepID=A0ABW8ZN11_9BURK
MPAVSQPGGGRFNAPQILIEANTADLDLGEREAKFGEAADFFRQTRNVILRIKIAASRVDPHFRQADDVASQPISKKAIERQTRRFSRQRSQVAMSSVPIATHRSP